MDYLNGSSAYNEIYSSLSGQSTTRLEGQLKGDYSKVTDGELMDACKQFESYFLEQVFKEMQKTISPDGESLSEKNNMVDYFKSQMIQEVAEDATENSSLGLAQMLYEQMRRNYGLDGNVADVTE